MTKRKAAEEAERELDEMEERLRRAKIVKAEPLEGSSRRHREKHRRTRRGH